VWLLYYTLTAKGRITTQLINNLAFFNTPKRINKGLWLINHDDPVEISFPPYFELYRVAKKEFIWWCLTFVSCKPPIQNCWGLGHGPCTPINLMLQDPPRFGSVELIRVGDGRDDARERFGAPVVLVRRCVNLSQENYSTPFISVVSFRVHFRQVCKPVGLY
jgi:hypothetical protein